MPYLQPFTEFRADEAIEQAQEDTIERGKDIWGLDYADNSDGLYPSGNQIGRTQFRPDFTRGELSSAQVFPETAGGQWRTVIDVGGVTTALGTTKTGFLTGTIGDVNGEVSDWLDFVVDEDAFIIHEGVFSRQDAPTISELQFNLSGTRIPVFHIEDIYVNEDSIHKGYFEVPNVVSPKSQVIYTVRSRRTNLIPAGVLDVNDVPGWSGVDSIAEFFGMMGEVIAKRSFIIRPNF